MSDTAVQSAPEAAPADKPGSEPKPGDPKPSRFRTDSRIAGEHLLEKPAPATIAPIKERATPPKDPATGQFVKAAGDPNAGVIPELRREDELEVEPQQQEQPPPPPQATAPQTEASAFVPVEIDMGDGRISTFKTKEALENYFKRMAGAQSAEQRRRVELERMVEDYRTKLAPAKEEGKGEEAPPEFRNPFEKSSIDDEASNALFQQLYRDVDDPEKGPVVAMARVIDHMEKRIQDLVKWIGNERRQATQPMERFLTAMNDINSTSEFFKAETARTNEDGSLKYPDIRSRKAVTELTQILHSYKLPLTPENFELAYNIRRTKSNSGGVAQPRREQPPDNSAAASAAAVMSGRAVGAPDPRAERRTPTIREEMDSIALNRGRFRTA